MTCPTCKTDSSDIYCTTCGTRTSVDYDNRKLEMRELRYCTHCRGWPALARAAYGEFCAVCGSETVLAQIRSVNEEKVTMWKVTNLLLDLSIRGVVMAWFFALPSVATCLLVVVANILCATGYYRWGDRNLRETKLLRYIGTSFFMAALVATFVLFFLIIAQMWDVPAKRRATFEPGTWSWAVSIGVVAGVELVLFGNVHAEFREKDYERKKE
jgi:hypothetical protein